MSATIKTVGIVGAGQMGSGIAHVAAQAGYRVLLYDVSPERIEKGIATVNGNMARQVSHGKLEEKDRQAAMGRISATPDIENLAGADLVIEAATEDETIKRKIYQQICPVLNPEAILATNTSSISITRLAAQTDRPERFIGIHFMNPVPVMKLVELVRGIATEDRTFEAAKAFVQKLDKTATVAEDFPGLHRQPHPAADDQRGDLYALRRRRLRRFDRHGHAARRQPSDGSAAARRLHRPRHLPVDHAGPA